MPIEINNKTWVHQMNKNGERLVDFCLDFDLVIEKTEF